MAKQKIIEIKLLGFPWKTLDPFLFCAYHTDAYPDGNDDLGPNVSLENRNIGQDFSSKDGWCMYHGDEIPGFPYHPHRGFETVTITKQGIVDHSDSLGASGRFGNGDVQWITTGKGIQHSEMFPLLNRDKKNPLEIFQIWLNLPGAKKMVDPSFKMLWIDTIPVVREQDTNGKYVEIKVIAGELNNSKAPNPTPDSWAANPVNDVAIWTIKMEANSNWTLPCAQSDVSRVLYFYKGGSLNIEEETVDEYHSIHINAKEEISLKAKNEDCYLLMLQGKPINEPIVQYGPFVMNTQEEIQQTISDYKKTKFGGWPWPRKDHVHGPSKGRFAKYADGTEEIPDNLKRTIN